MKSTRDYDALDRILMGFEDVCHSLTSGKTRISRQNPADRVADMPLTAGEIRESAGLMRVNHAGEVSAQALYQGQGLTARDPAIKVSMQRSAQEEIDHLVWCRERLDALGGHCSYLDPIWYTGSFTLGILAGVMGDKWSLGFVAETEQQVVRHLDSHLARLPENDYKSRAILKQMRDDERHHATVAMEAGAAELPETVQKLMGLCSKIMTGTAYWI